MKNIIIVTIDCDNNMIRIMEEGKGSVCETKIEYPNKWISFYQHLFDLMSKGDEFHSLYVRLEMQSDGRKKIVEEW